MAISLFQKDISKIQSATLLVLIICLASFDPSWAGEKITTADKCRVWKAYVDRRVSRYREEIEVMRTKEAYIDQRLARPESFRNEREKSVYSEKKTSIREKIRLNQLKIERFQQRRNCEYAAGLSPIKYRYCKWVLEASRQGKSTGSKFMSFMSEMGKATKEEIYELKEWLGELGE